MIIIVPKKTLSSRKKSQLSKKGYTVIECDEPERVKVIAASPTNHLDDLFMAALKGLEDSHPISRAEKFTNELQKRLLEKEDKRK